MKDIFRSRKSRRTEPYATAIIPTHDRVSTLAQAVASVQRQSVADLEIIIAGDGVTPAVRELAQGLAGNDSRVIFRDWEKAPGHGLENRDRAVCAAKAERIFYNDDDDLWLPEHLATLGPALNRVETANTPALSLTTAGELQLALVNYSDETPMRLALAKNISVKLTFDTHFAHRKETYLRLGRPWIQRETDRPVGRFMAAFAADSVTSWETLPNPTAISLHGSARKYWSENARAKEITQWLEQTGKWESWRFMEKAAVERHFMTCLHFFPPARGNDLESYLAGLEVTIARVDDKHIPNFGYHLSEFQIDELKSVFELFMGKAKATPLTANLIIRLAAPFLGTDPETLTVANVLLGAFGAQRAVSLLSNTKLASAQLKDLRDGLLVELATDVGHLDGIRKKIERRGTMREDVLKRVVACARQRLQATVNRQPQN